MRQEDRSAASSNSVFLRDIQVIEKLKEVLEQLMRTSEKIHLVFPHQSHSESVDSLELD